jgi:hypothetical protein
MSRMLPWLLRIGVAAALMAGTVALSHVPWSATAGTDGALRLAWRYRSALVDECREPTAAELARLPAHMRQRRICERRLLPYELTVMVDSARIVLDTVHAGGARADRPLSLFRESRLAPGRHRLSVRFAPLAVAAGAAVPPTLVLDTTVTVAAHAVVLVTLDDVSGGLVVPRRP